MLIRAYAAVASLRLLGFGFAAAFLGLVTIAMPAGDFGRFSLALSIIQVIASGLLSFGNIALLRFAREEYEAKGRIGEALGARLALYAITLSLVLAGLWLLFPRIGVTFGLTADALLLVALGLVAVSLNEMGTFCAQSVERFAGYGLVPATFRFIQLATLAAMYLVGATSWQILMLGTVAGYTAGALVSWSRIPAAALRAVRAHGPTVRRFFAYSWSTPLAALAVMLISWMDLWFIEAFHGTHDVGIYAWAYTICLLMTALVTPLGALLAPRLIDLRVSNDTIGLHQFMALSKSMVVALIAVAPLAEAAFALGSGGIGLGAYKEAVPAAMILIAAVTFQLGINLWYQTVLAHEDLIVGATMVLVAAALVNGLGDWLLVPPLGGIGAALATTASLATAMTGLLWLVERRIGRTPGPGLVQIVGFAGAMLVPAAIAANLPLPGAAVLCVVSTTGLIPLGRQLGLFRSLAPACGRLARFPGWMPALTLRAISWLSTCPERQA